VCVRTLPSGKSAGSVSDSLLLRSRTSADYVKLATQETFNGRRVYRLDTIALTSIMRERRRRLI